MYTKNAESTFSNITFINNTREDMDNNIIFIKTA